MSKELSCSNAPSTSSNSESTLPGVSKETWDRFSALKERRERQSYRSTAKRIRDIKSTLASRIENELSNPDELEALRSNDVELSSLCAKEKLQRKANESPDNRFQEQFSNKHSAEQNVTESSWLEVKPYLGINSHLNEETGGNAAPRTGLELSVNRAVALKEYDVAEQLSDRLAARNFGSKIAEAIDAKRFIAKRKHEEAVKNAAKKKKLAWGFEPKHRWETKGNM